MNYLIQLPNDAVSVGYTKTGDFSFKQVYKSESAGFTGTEQQFLKAGHAYAYVQTGPYTRFMVTP